MCRHVDCLSECVPSGRLFEVLVVRGKNDTVCLIVQRHFGSWYDLECVFRVNLWGEVSLFKVGQLDFLILCIAW